MDKGGLILVILLLAVIVAGAVLLNASDPVDTAIASAQVGIVTAPAAVSPVGALWTFAGRAVIMLAGMVILIGLGWLAWQRLAASREAGWKPGPNAHWQRSGGLPKRLSLADLLTLQITRQMMNDQQPRSATLPDERDRMEF